MAKDWIDFWRFDWTVVCGYYAMYHAVLAALYHIGLAARSHGCAVAAFRRFYIDLADLAPRIKEFRTQVEELERSKAELVKAGTIEKVKIGGPEVKAYVEDLQDLLLTGSVVERKSFLRSWIKRIDLDRPKSGTIEYTLPLVPTNGDHPSNLEVLSIEQAGVPDGTMSELFQWMPLRLS